MKFINPQIPRFAGAGVINVVLSYAVYSLLLFFIPYEWAYTLAYIFGIYLSYYLNALYVFNAQPTLLKALQFPLIYLFQYGLGLVLLSFFIEKMAVNPFVAPWLVTAITMPISFLLMRRVLKRSWGADER